MNLKTKHLLVYCNICEDWSIQCVSCGNNACNGTQGCLDCQDAEIVQRQYWQDPNSIEFDNED